jgi:hypothetical protein
MVALAQPGYGYLEIEHEYNDVAIDCVELDSTIVCAHSVQGDIGSDFFTSAHIYAFNDELAILDSLIIQGRRARFLFEFGSDLLLLSYGTYPLQEGEDIDIGLHKIDANLEILDEAYFTLSQESIFPAAYLIDSGILTVALDYTSISGGVGIIQYDEGLNLIENLYYENTSINGFYTDLSYLYFDPVDETMNFTYAGVIVTPFQEGDVILKINQNDFGEYDLLSSSQVYMNRRQNLWHEEQLLIVHDVLSFDDTVFDYGLLACKHVINDSVFQNEIVMELGFDDTGLAIGTSPMIETLDGELIVGAQLGPDPNFSWGVESKNLVKFNLTDGITWISEFDFLGSDDRFSIIEPLTNGNYLIGGVHSNNEAVFQSEHAFYMIVNEEGQLITNIEDLFDDRSQEFLVSASGSNITIVNNSSIPVKAKLLDCNGRLICERHLVTGLNSFDAPVSQSGVFILSVFEMGWFSKIFLNP